MGTKWCVKDLSSFLGHVQMIHSAAGEAYCDDQIAYPIVNGFL
jgi:hypothetical protein